MTGPADPSHAESTSLIGGRVLDQDIHIACAEEGTLALTFSRFYQRHHKWAHNLTCARCGGPLGEEPRDAS